VQLVNFFLIPQLFPVLPTVSRQIAVSPGKGNIMAELGLSTIAQLLFPGERSIEFARIVSELESVMARFEETELKIAWDCDDFVSFDIPGTRILLSWAQVERRGYGGCLTVSVGPGDSSLRGGHEDLCSRLVDRIQCRFDPVAVLWCQAEGVIDSEVVDALLDNLPHLGTVLPDIDSVVAGLTEQEAALTARKSQPPAPPPTAQTTSAAARPTPKATPKTVATKAQRPSAKVAMRAANDQPMVPRPRDRELDRVRHALYPQDDRGLPYSTQMRLAVHCLNATLIVVWVPMGAALMTYSILKGENMRLSSRIMAVTGTLLALAHSPLGMTMAALAKSIG
jgi:hypothetical protein